MNQEKDPMGQAIADFYNSGKAAKLRVFSPDFDEDEIPVETLFRPLTEMPPLEQHAIKMASGDILDVGAGAGCHSLALQAMNKQVTAIDISPLSVKTMTARGVADAREIDFWEINQRFDTILMLMNGIGIVGKADKLSQFFRHIDKILSPFGQVLLDSSDISYLFEDENGEIDIPEMDAYYGELTYRMQYKNIKGASFAWLYIDFETLSRYAAENGFVAEMVARGEHYDYLARITRKNP